MNGRRELWCPVGRGTARLGPISRGRLLAAAAALQPAGLGWSAGALDTALLSGRTTGLAVIGLRTGAPAALLGCIFWRTVLPEAEVLLLAVGHTHRRRGTGAALLGAAVRVMAARGVRTVTLEAACSNRPALALYRKAGFEQAGRRPRYYRGHDGLVLRKLLPESRRRILSGRPEKR